MRASGFRQRRSVNRMGQSHDDETLRSSGSPLGAALEQVEYTGMGRSLTVTSARTQPWPVDLPAGRCAVRQRHSQVGLALGERDVRRATTPHRAPRQSEPGDRRQCGARLSSTCTRTLTEPEPHIREAPCCSATARSRSATSRSRFGGQRFQERLASQLPARTGVAGGPPDDARHECLNLSTSGASST